MSQCVYACDLTVQTIPVAVAYRDVLSQPACLNKGFKVWKFKAFVRACIGQINCITDMQIVIILRVNSVNMVLVCLLYNLVIVVYVSMASAYVFSHE